MYKENKNYFLFINKNTTTILQINSISQFILNTTYNVGVNISIINLNTILLKTYRSLLLIISNKSFTWRTSCF